MASFSILLPEHIPDMWDEVAPFLDLSLCFTSGENTLDDLKKSCLAGQSTICVGHEGPELKAAILTYFVEYPQFKVCEFALAGSVFNAGLIPEAIEALIAWAKFNNCARVRVVGRKGWQKMLKPHGFSLESVTMGKWI